MAYKPYEIVAPFDGVIRDLSFTYGQSVTAGQVLFVMDTSTIDQAMRDAQSAYLKADVAEQAMAGWSTGPDVARARRAVDAARLALSDTEAKAVETKKLLDKGLVARSEYDGLVQQHRVETMTLDGAEADLQTELGRGVGENRRITSTDLLNARARLDAVEHQAHGAVVRAAVAGIITRPTVTKEGGANGEPHPGEQLTSGQLLGFIAKAGALAVTFQLNEADANKVYEGQRVTVTGPGFETVTATGHIVSVSAQASEQTGGDATPMFDGLALLDDLPSDLVQRVRIGMSANITVVLSDGVKSVTVPPQAITISGGRATVAVEQPGTPLTKRTVVGVGRTGPHAVEITSGISSGTKVMLPSDDGSRR